MTFPSSPPKKHVELAWWVLHILRGRGIPKCENLLIISCIHFPSCAVLTHRSHQSEGCSVSENKPDQVMFSLCVFSSGRCVYWWCGITDTFLPQMQVSFTSPWSKRKQLYLEVTDETRWNFYFLTHLKARYEISEKASLSFTLAPPSLPPSLLFFLPFFFSCFLLRLLLPFHLPFLPHSQSTYSTGWLPHSI